MHPKIWHQRFETIDKEVLVLVLLSCCFWSDLNQSVNLYAFRFTLLHLQLPYTYSSSWWTLIRLIFSPLHYFPCCQSISKYWKHKISSRGPHILTLAPNCISNRSGHNDKWNRHFYHPPKKKLNADLLPVISWISIWSLLIFWFAKEWNGCKKKEEKKGRGKWRVLYY